MWLTAFDIAAGGSDLTIEGRALSADLVPAYLQRLNNEPPMQGRKFASVVIAQPGVRDAKKGADAKESVTSAAMNGLYPSQLLMWTTFSTTIQRGSSCSAKRNT